MTSESDEVKTEIMKAHAIADQAIRVSESRLLKATKLDTELREAKRLIKSLLQAQEYSSRQHHNEVMRLIADFDEAMAMLKQLRGYVSESGGVGLHMNYGWSYYAEVYHEAPTDALGWQYVSCCQAERWLDATSAVRPQHRRPCPTQVAVLAGDAWAKTQLRRRAAMKARWAAKEIA